MKELILPEYPYKIHPMPGISGSDINEHLKIERVGTLFGARIISVDHDMKGMRLELSREGLSLHRFDEIVQFCKEYTMLTWIVRSKGISLRVYGDFSQLVLLGRYYVDTKSKLEIFNDLFEGVDEN